MYGIWAIMLLVAIWQIPLLLAKRRYRDLLVFLAIWVVSTVYASLVAGGVTLPSPMEVITAIIEKGWEYLR